MKIKAFTMLEALISIILTGIIVALSYSLFTLISKQISVFEKENTDVINYNLFNSTIIMDIETSNDFYFANDQLVLQNYSKPDIFYGFNKNIVTRTLDGFTTDTMSIKPIQYSYTENASPRQSRLDMRIKLLQDTIRINYFLTKQNAQRINKKLFNED